MFLQECSKLYVHGLTVYTYVHGLTVCTYVHGLTVCKYVHGLTVCTCTWLSVIIMILHHNLQCAAAQCTVHEY